MRRVTIKVLQKLDSESGVCDFGIPVVEHLNRSDFPRADT